MKSGKFGAALMASGIVMMLLAGGLAGWNLWENHRAAHEAEQMLLWLEPLRLNLPQREESAPTEETVIPDYILAPNMEMPTETVDGWDYVGTLEIPTLGLTLPIIDQWSYPALRKAPCRYIGSVYSGDMVIAAHNYAAHFGRLHTLLPGDEIRFIDMDGNLFTYEVTLLETLGPNAVEEMKSDVWDLSLFTCTLGGGARVTVRCLQAEGSVIS